MPLQIQLAILFAGLCFQYSTWSLREWRTEQPPDPTQVSYWPQLTLFSTAEYHAAAVTSSLLPQLFLVSISNIHKSLILRYRDSQSLFYLFLTTFLCIGGTYGLAQHHLSCASVTSKAGESEDPLSWRWFIACHPELLYLPIPPAHLKWALWQFIIYIVAAQRSQPTAMWYSRFWVNWKRQVCIPKANKITVTH